MTHAFCMRVRYDAWHPSVVIRSTMTAFVIERQAAITDLAIDVPDKLIGSTRRKAEISRKERRLREADVLDGVALDHLKLGEALLSARDKRATPILHRQSQPPSAGTD